MQRGIDSETVEDILSRCLQISKQTLSDNTIAFNIRGNPTSSIDHVCGIFGMPTGLPDYWQDYIRNELIRRGVASEDIFLRKTAADDGFRSQAEVQHLQRIFYSLTDSESIILSEPYDTIEFTVGTRSTHWIFLFRDRFPDGTKK